MIDYGTPGRRKFLRQIRILAFLRAVYVALVGVSVGATVGAFIILFTRKP